MIDLDLLRNHINQLDQEIAERLEQRLEISKDVARAKQENQTPVQDSTREESILKALKDSENGLSDQFLETIWTAIFVESRRRQEEYLAKK